MTGSRQSLTQRARRALRAIERRRRDPRYVRVFGRLVAAGLLKTNVDVPACRTRITVEDTLWAGEVEPRILELLPALLVKRPALFVDSAALPDDLARVVDELRANQPPSDFRGVPGAMASKLAARAMASSSDRA